MDAAALSVHLAEAALAAGDLDAAACHAYVTRLITARPFLPGIEGEWAHAWRCRLEDHRIRAIECMAEEQLQRGQTTAAIRSAEQHHHLAPVPAWTDSRANGRARLLRHAQHAPPAAQPYRIARSGRA